MLVGSEGKITTTIEKAIESARKQELDLVQLSEKDGVAVCKLMDYKKYQFDQKKKEKRNNKDKQELKEVRIGDATAENDLKVKVKTADRILSEGDKVKVTITYKGRMQTFITRGIEKLVNFEKFMQQPHNVDLKPKIDGNRVIMVVSPKNK